MLKCQQLFYEQDKFRAQLSWAWKTFYNLEPWSWSEDKKQEKLLELDVYIYCVRGD